MIASRRMIGVMMVGSWFAESHSWQAFSNEPNPITPVLLQNRQGGVVAPTATTASGSKASARRKTSAGSIGSAWLVLFPILSYFRGAGGGASDAEEPLLALADSAPPKLVTVRLRRPRAASRFSGDSLAFHFA